MARKNKAEYLERCLQKTDALIEMMAQHQAAAARLERVQRAEDTWLKEQDEILDDYAHAKNFNLTLIEQEDLLDWMANQRDYARLCNEVGLDDCEANRQARDDRRLLRGKA